MIEKLTCIKVSYGSLTSYHSCWSAPYFLNKFYDAVTVRVTPRWEHIEQ